MDAATSQPSDSEKAIEKVKSKIASYQDFPKKGILFYDMMGIFSDPAATKECISLFVDHIRANYIQKQVRVDAICGLEARGFLLGPLIASQLDVAFIPIRKRGKLPGVCVQQEYVLEYGTDCIEIQRPSIPTGYQVIIVDDLLATGGTLVAAVKLVQSANAVPLAAMVLMELMALKGRDKLPTDVTCTAFILLP